MAYSCPQNENETKTIDYEDNSENIETEEEQTPKPDDGDNLIIEEKNETIEDEPENETEPEAQPEVEKKKDKDTLDGIFEIIKGRTSELEAFEIWHDVIEYKGIELIWKSFFNAKEKKMGVEVLYSRDNHPDREPLH